MHFKSGIRKILQSIVLTISGHFKSGFRKFLFFIILIILRISRISRSVTGRNNTRFASEPLIIIEPPSHTIHTLRPTTGLCTRPVDLAADYFILLGHAPDCVLGFHPRLVDFAPNHWALHPTTGLLSECQVFCPSPKKLTQFRPMCFHSLFPNVSEVALGPSTQHHCPDPMHLDLIRMDDLYPVWIWHHEGGCDISDLLGVL